MRIRVAQIGARRHYAVPVALYRAGLLESLHTDWCANRGLPRLLSTITPRRFAGGGLKRIGDRRVPSIPRHLITTYSRHTLQALRMRRKWSASRYEYWARANAAFASQVVAQGFGEADAVYGFNAAAAEILTEARRRGLRTILDQTMAPWQVVETLLAEERERWPGWESEPPDGSWEELADRESREWESADVIVCGSQYVVDAVVEAGGPGDRCRVVPYGYNGPPADPPAKAVHRGPLRVLFVGTVDLRKGVPYLLEAARNMAHAVAEFRVVGPLQVQDAAITTLRQHTQLVGPVPRSRVREHYQWADVLVLPTLAEGSANVCYEAMAHGLPVITTPNAGAVVRDGVDGWIVPPRCSAALVEHIARIAGHRELLDEAAHAARRRSAMVSWTQYMHNLTEALSWRRSEVAV